MNIRSIIEIITAALLRSLGLVGKGRFGERAIAGFLLNLDKERYRVLNDIYLPLPDGTTSQIDHIVISPHGVFVVETKTYSGWIFGDADSKMWTQCLPGQRDQAKKFTFQNPIRQNFRHICAIEDCTGIPKGLMRTVIAFSGEATFKTARPQGVCYFAEVLDYIRSYSTPIIRMEQLDEIADVISGWQATLTMEQKASHVKNLKARHDGVYASQTPPVCPRCGARMARRARKSDGKAFYGCSNYPKCKGIVNIC